MSAIALAAHQRVGAEEDGEGESAPPSAEIVPVEQVLREIRQRFDGRVLSVELGQEWRIGGRIWVYEAKVLTPNGDVLELEYDAGTLELLEQKGRERSRGKRAGED